MSSEAKEQKKFTSSNHKRFRRGNGNAGKTDGHVAEIKDLTIHDNEEYDSDTTIGFIAQHNKACHEQEALGMIAGTLNELCEGTFTCDSHIDIDCYVNEVLSSSHHTADQLHAYPLEQESECKDNDVFIDSLLHDYALVCEEAYLSGSSNINLKPTVNQTQTALRLRSVGHMRVNRIHNSPSGKVLKVLFDTGSDKTLINKSALPKQAIPAKDKNPPNITRLHDTKPLDRYVMLDGIHFPEFSPTTKVAKSIKAAVFDNKHSSYDVIIGMDIMQPLGFRIDCSTLTISWNENTIPF
jgi:Aspartyl protease